MTDAPQAPTFRRVLGIETSTRVQALALLDGDEILEHRQQRARYNHASSLIFNLEEVLKEQNLTVHDLDLVTVGLGPGSFTGLRVGMATAKALARAAKVPIAGVSSLAALAYPFAVARPGALVCAAIDARRQEVYAATFRLHDGRLETVTDERTVPPALLRDELVADARDTPLTVVGDALSQYDELRHWQHPNILALAPWAAPPSATAVALLGRQKVLAHGGDDLAALEPNYIRPSDARLPGQ